MLASVRKSRDVSRVLLRQQQRVLVANHHGSVLPPLFPNLNAVVACANDNDADDSRSIVPAFEQNHRHNLFMQASRERKQVLHGALAPGCAGWWLSTVAKSATKPTNMYPADLPLRRNSYLSSDYQSSAHLRMIRPALPRMQSAYFSTTNKEIPSRKLGKTKIPTPPSSPPEEIGALASLSKATPKTIFHKTADLVIWSVQSVGGFVLKVPGNAYYFVRHPDEFRTKFNGLKQMAKDEVNHYLLGFKLFWADMQTARTLVGRTLRGSSLTRRERKQLLRTVTDMFRLIPFSMFILIPFMEFALPLALKLFPNMLPSTFQDSLKAEESMKRELQSRIAMAQFFQETMEELAKEQKRKAAKRKKELEEAGVDMKEDTIEQQEDSAASMLNFLEKARNGEVLDTDAIIRYANYFQDDLTLDNMPRMQLINMCKYMSIPPYGSESFLRFQLRHKIRVLKEDDQRILWEGIDSLTKMELREACQERGMRSTGLSKEAYKRNLQQWLDLSVNKKVPASLLIMSRTFFLRDESEPSQPGDEEKKDLSGLADAISSLDKEVLNEVILEMATQKESSDPEIRKIKLEVLNKQNELIREELEAREAAEKKKKEKDAADAAEKKAAAETKEAEEADAATIFSTKDIPIPSEEVKLAKEAGGAEEKQKNEQDDHLSTHEMDALSQLVSDDPVSKERAELQKIKSAMVEKDEPTVQDDVVPSESLEQAFFDSSQPLTSKQADQIAQALVEDIKEIVRHDGTTTQISMDGKLTPESIPTTRKEQEEEYVDPVVSRLKQRIESMVDKIEIQLSEAEVKIGDKLHLLDKDRDGVLSQSEMASVLQQVLKRDVSFDEAMDIARAMDANNDGVFTVDELIKWINEHKLVKYAKEDRDDEMDRIMESQAESAKEGEAKQAEEAKKAKQGTTEAPKMG